MHNGHADLEARRLRAEARATRERRGTFRGASGSMVGGSVFVEPSRGGVVVTFADDFRLEGGDDPRIAFGSAAAVDRSAQVARLKRTSGTQRYLSEAIDPSRFTHLYLWCATSDVVLARAALR